MIGQALEALGAITALILLGLAMLAAGQMVLRYFGRVG